MCRAAFGFIAFVDDATWRVLPGARPAVLPLALHRRRRRRSGRSPALPYPPLGQNHDTGEARREQERGGDGLRRGCSSQRASTATVRRTLVRPFAIRAKARTRVRRTRQLQTAQWRADSQTREYQADSPSMWPRSPAGTRIPSHIGTTPEQMFHQARHTGPRRRVLTGHFIPGPWSAVYPCCSAFRRFCSYCRPVPASPPPTPSWSPT